MVNLTTTSNEFEQLYLGIRAKENRIYTDEQVQHLPIIDKKHIYNREWKIRKHSSDQLFNYLSKKRKALNILEIGCGNGWLSAKMAEIEGSQVTGIDINGYEISQARRVFKQNNLDFINEGLGFIKRTAIKFNIIVFAAAIQYFSSLKEVIQQVKECLAEGGEIHILDTNFYHENTVEKAIASSVSYFNDKDCPAMKLYYFHHLLSDFNSFNFQILYHPNRFLNKVIHRHPFYWICIYK